MKNFLKLLAIIAFIAIIGFSMTTCDNDSDETDTTTYSLEGTWASLSEQYTFTGDNFEYLYKPGISKIIKGTFTHTSTQITFNTTHKGMWLSSTGTWAWEETTISSGQTTYPPHFNYDSPPVSYKIERTGGDKLDLTIGNYNTFAWSSSMHKR